MHIMVKFSMLRCGEGEAFAALTEISISSMADDEFFLYVLSSVRAPVFVMGFRES